MIRVNQKQKGTESSFNRQLLRQNYLVFFFRLKFDQLNFF